MVVGEGVMAETTGHIDDIDRPWRPASVGQSFVYVFPCHGEDILKLGFSRDPLNRLQTLHQRYFEFFDIDRAFLIQTDRVREARAIEHSLKIELALHNAPAPLVVERKAGGHTEWYRGASIRLRHAAGGFEHAASSKGFVVEIRQGTETRRR